MYIQFFSFTLGLLKYWRISFNYFFLSTMNNYYYWYDHCYALLFSFSFSNYFLHSFVLVFFPVLFWLFRKTLQSMMQSQGRLVFSLSKKEFIICSLGSQWFLLFRINEWILCMILMLAVFDLCPPTQSSMHRTALQYTNYSSLGGIMKERKNRRKKHGKWVKKKKE